MHPVRMALLALVVALLPSAHGQAKPNERPRPGAPSPAVVAEDLPIKVFARGKNFYIKKNGEPLFSRQFDLAYPFSRDGLAAVKVDEKFGFINLKGDLVIVPRFEDASGFSEGLAPVKLTGKWGVINAKGEVVIAPQYHYLNGFQDGIAVASIKLDDDKSKFTIIDRTGKNVCGHTDPAREGYADIRSLSEGLVGVKVGDKWGFVDKKCKLVIAPRIDDLWWGTQFSEGLAAAKQGTMWGLIDKTGAIVVEPKFDAVRAFSEGLVAVRVGSKWGFIDKTGATVIPMRYDDVNEFSEGLASVKVNGLYQFIDKTGKVVIQPEFKMAGAFYKGVAFVSTDDFQGCIDNTGRLFWKTPDPYTPYWKGLELGNAHKWEEALRMFDKAIERWPEYPDALGARANAFLELGSNRKALEDATKALQQNPKLAFVYVNRGLAHHRLGQFQDAIEDYNEAIRLDPNIKNARENRQLSQQALANGRQSSTAPTPSSSSPTRNCNRTYPHSTNANNDTARKLDAWVGLPESRLIREWGAPSRSAPDGRGGHVVYYDGTMDRYRHVPVLNGNGRYVGGYNVNEQQAFHMDLWIDDCGVVYNWSGHW